jgi:hypothetical protein
MNLAELNKAIARKHNLLTVEGRSLTDPEYQALLAEKDALLNPPEPEKPAPRAPKKPTRKK